MKALVGAFNQEKALEVAFSVIVQPVVETMDRFTALFEVPYSDYGWVNDIAVIFNTWGHDWQDGSSSPQGPEPYCGEYINGVALPESLAAAGFRGINQIEYTFFDSVFLAYKQTVPFTPAPGPGRS